MRQFVRIQTEQRVIPGLMEGTRVRDISSFVKDITPQTLSEDLSENLEGTRFPFVEGAYTFLQPLQGVSQLIATGFNYKSHIEEMHVPIPTEPEIFFKSIYSLVGPYDPIIYGAQPIIHLDWETELGVVIKKPTCNISREEAAEYIFGYILINDISDRYTQIDAEGQHHLARAKSRATYGPIGPYLTCGIDPQQLDMWTKINGQEEQKGHTSDMLFDVHTLISYCSSYMTLMPVDIFATGTPPGVGLGKKRFMMPGDILECGITHLGQQKHVIVMTP